MTTKKILENSRERRDFICSAISAMAIGIAGCSTAEENEFEDEDPSQPRENEEVQHSEISSAKDSVEEAYEHLAAVPVTDGNEFVFEVTAFEDRFDHQEVITLAEEALESLEATPETETTSGVGVDELRTVAHLARSLAYRRFFLHQLLVSGAMAYDRLLADEISEAQSIIQESHVFLGELQEREQNVEEQYTAFADSKISVSHYDMDSVDQSIEVLDEIIDWAEPTYMGLEHFITSQVRIEQSISAMEKDDYESAHKLLEGVISSIENTEAWFSEAQGRGREIGYIEPIVNSVRCLLPVYESMIEGFQTALVELEAGNEERARELVEESRTVANQGINRCES